MVAALDAGTARLRAEHRAVAGARRDLIADPGLFRFMRQHEIARGGGDVDLEGGPGRGDDRIEHVGVKGREGEIGGAVAVEIERGDVGHTSDLVAGRRGRERQGQVARRVVSLAAGEGGIGLGQRCAGEQRVGPEPPGQRGIRPKPRRAGQVSLDRHGCFLHRAGRVVGPVTSKSGGRAEWRSRGTTHRRPADLRTRRW